MILLARPGIRRLNAGRPGPDGGDVMLGLQLRVGGIEKRIAIAGQDELSAPGLPKSWQATQFLSNTGWTSDT